MPCASLFCTFPAELLSSLIFHKLVEGSSRQISLCSISNQDLENWDLSPPSPPPWEQSEKELLGVSADSSDYLIDVLAKRMWRLLLKWQHWEHNLGSCGGCAPCQVSVVGGANLTGAWLLQSQVLPVSREQDV